MARRKHLSIYQSKGHLLFTLCVVVAPFFYLLFFSRLANIAFGSLFLDLATSFVRLVIAYVIAALLGWGLALLFYRGKRSAIALPAFDVLQSFPTFALLPLATLLLGASNVAVIFFLVITIIWPVLFSVIASLKLIKHDWEEAVQIEGLTGFMYFKHFLLPVSLPGLITGSIIGLGEGWEALVATEIIIAIPNGLGDFFKTFSTSPRVTALGILGLLILIFSLSKLVWLPLLDWANHTMEE